MPKTDEELEYHKKRLKNAGLRLLNHLLNPEPSLPYKIRYYTAKFPELKSLAQSFLQEVPDASKAVSEVSPREDV